MKPQRWMVFAIALTAVACSDAGFESVKSPLAVDGPWEPPAEIVAEAASYDITFVSAGPWVGTSGCSGTFTQGGRVFKEWLEDYWPQIEHIGGYSCRPINGDSSTMSVHATGRAVDIHIPLDGGAADNGLGDPLANWLIKHADEIGIQSIIWDRWMWSPSREPRSRYYGGAHAHHDHLHVELTPDAADMKTPWFNGPMGPPDLGDCDEPLPAEGGVVDDTNECFQAFGPAQYWRRVDGQGEEGRLLWTNAFQSDEPSNWARWRLNLAEGGAFKVEYNHVSEYAKFDSARFEVKFGDQTEEIFVDLSAGEDGWQELGEFEFAAGEGQYVAIFDNHAGEVGEDQHILADAIRLIRPEVEPPATDDVIVPPEDDDGVGAGGASEPDGSRPPQTDEMPDQIHARGGCQTVATTAGSRPPVSVIVLVLLGLMLALREARGRRST